MTEISNEEKEYREHVEERLKKCSYKIVDDRRYSFVFDQKTFTFRIPTRLESVKIKAILAQITYSENGVISSTNEIIMSGDLDLMCSAKLITHMSVLLDSIVDNVNIENKIFGTGYLDNLTEENQFDLGYLILICEREFLDSKKKA